MHLLKESAKPVPMGKKRRKVAALEMIPVNPNVFVPNVNMEEEEEKKEEHQEEEKKGNIGSKRNKSKPQPFMQMQ